MWFWFVFYMLVFLFFLHYFLDNTYNTCYVYNQDEGKTNNQNREEIMKNYEIKFGVWENGSGWQCHDIADRYADTFEEAVCTANKMISICDGIQVIADITDIETGNCKTIGW